MKKVRRMCSLAVMMLLLVASSSEALVHMGMKVLEDGILINFGTGRFYYKNLEPGQAGLLHGSAYTDPLIYFANVKVSDCYPGYTDYEGLNQIQEFTNPDDYEFSLVHQLVVAHPDSGCNQGVILYRQGNLYGGLEILDFDGTSLVLRYWYDDNGASDYSDVPFGKIYQGQAVVRNYSYYNFGTGDIFYSYHVPGKSGYLMGAAYSYPPVSFANVTSTSACDDYGYYAGYQGVKRISDLVSADDFEFTSPRLVLVGDRDSVCYSRILLFKQGHRYGGLKILDIDEYGDLHFKYWYDSTGGSNFSQIHKKN